MRKTLYGTLGETLCGNLMRNLRRTLCGNSCGPQIGATLDRHYAGLRRAFHGHSPSLGEFGVQVDRNMPEPYAEPYAEPYSPKVGAKMGNLVHPRFFLRFSSN